MAFPDSPVELPNGKLVCEDHGLEICYQCCCDYTPLNEDHEHRQSIKECSVSSEDVSDIIFQMAESTTNVLQGAAARSVANVTTMGALITTPLEEHVPNNAKS
jgi:ribonuclease HI